MLTSDDEVKYSNQDERYLLIRNYRNIGLTKPAKLVLNRSTQEGRMGDLVILAGPNNSGKSNIIDALESIRMGTFSSDSPEMVYPKANPVLSLVVGKDKFNKSFRNPDLRLDLPTIARMLDESNLDDNQKEVFEKFILSGRFVANRNYRNDVNNLVGSEITVSNMVKFLNGNYSDDCKTVACHMITNLRDSEGRISKDVSISYGYYTNSYTDYLSPIIADEAYDCSRLQSRMVSLGYDEDQVEVVVSFMKSGEYVDTPLEIGKHINMDSGRSLSREYMVDYVRNHSRDHTDTSSLMVRLILLTKGANVDFSEYDPHESIQDNVSPLVRYKLGRSVEVDEGRSEVNIIRYEPKLGHKQTEFKTSTDEPSKLFVNLFRFLGYPDNFLDNIMSNYESMGGQMNILRDMEDAINNRMNKLNGLFNSMYLSHSSPYKFKVYVEKDSISLSFKKGNAYMKLDNQSVGFQWFFDFFFNVVLSDKLSPGDIVIMDEPATNLHVKGQVELRKTMKEYAKRHQITFVISTHSPFMIDTNYLDEVRIVSRKDDGESEINNHFQTVPGADEEFDYSADKMEEILNALTVGRNVMMDPYAPQVFVEGVTDYNYLTAFAVLFGVKDISFMPVGGLKNRDLGDKLRHISRDPILLVDSDEAGYRAKEDYDKVKRIQVIALSDIDPSFSGDYGYGDFREKCKEGKGFTIEDLFSESDRKWILQDRKESDFSSVFKTYIDEYDEMISQETKDNFRKVFEYFKQEFMME